MKLSISTTHRQTLLGWAYLLITLFVLPSALHTVNDMLATPLSESVLNSIFFTVNFSFNTNAEITIVISEFAEKIIAINAGDDESLIAYCNNDILTHINKIVKES